MKATLRYTLTATAKGGDTVVLLHSLGCDHGLWDGVVAQWQGKRRTIAVDLPGHGESPRWPAGFSLTDCADAVVGVLDTLGVERAVWAGNSVGGLIVQAAALKYPERVQALVLSATDSRIGTLDSWNQRIRQVGEYGLSGLATDLTRRWFAERFIREQEEQYAKFVRGLAKLSADSYIAMAMAIRDADYTHRLGELERPTLILCGEKDVYCPPASGRKLAERILGANFCELRDVAHQPPIESALDWCARTDSFLMGLSGV